MVVGPAPYLDKTGFNLVNVLFHRSQQLKKVWSTIQHNLRAEFPYVEDLFFPPDPSGGKIALAWRDTRSPQGDMFAYQMSDGMLQFLCLLAGLVLPAGMASVLAFDEPDIHLHPSAVRRFVSLANSVAAHTPVLIATHSNVVLDALANPVSSILVSRSDDTGAHVEQLEPLALASWLDDYSASELRQKGMLDQDNAHTASQGIT